MNKLYKFLTILFLISLSLPAGKTFAETNSYIAFSMAKFDIFKKANESIENRLEYRHYRSGWIIHPFSGIMLNTDGAKHIYTGVILEFFNFQNIYLTPSFAPGLYFGGRSKKLHLILEFRSQIEISYKFKNNIRFGFSLNHISNAGLGPPNPGVESVAFSLIIPIFKNIHGTDFK